MTTNTKSRDQDIVEFYVSNTYSMAEIARLYGISRQRVLQILHAEGVETNETARREAARRHAADEIEQAEDLLRVNLSEVASRHGTTVESIRAALEEDGFDYDTALQEQRLAMHRRRVEGKGTAVCRKCGKRKPWTEMRMRTLESGIQSRDRICKPCVNRMTKAWYLRNQDGFDVSVEEKECSNCEVVKPASEFHRSRRQKSGLQSWCKQCQRENRQR